MTLFPENPQDFQPGQFVERSQLAQLAQLLAEIFTDAHMALNGDWDRSDEGFECQLENVETCYTALFGTDIRHHPTVLSYSQERAS